MSRTKRTDTHSSEIERYLKLIQASKNPSTKIPLWQLNLQVAELGRSVAAITVQRIIRGFAARLRWKRRRQWIHNVKAHSPKIGEAIILEATISLAVQIANECVEEEVHYQERFPVPPVAFRMTVDEVLLSLVASEIRSVVSEVIRQNTQAYIEERCCKMLILDSCAPFYAMFIERWI
jgi:hypothetical protein